MTARPQPYALTIATARMNKDAGLRREQILEGRSDRQRHIAAGRVCVRCEGPRGLYPVCDHCQEGS